MADKELQAILNSGDINSIYIGGATSSEAVKTKGENDALYVNLAGSTAATKALFNPQVTAPAYQEGQMFYDDNTGTLALQGRYPDVTLNAGREMHIEVLNNTGATIQNGYAVRQNGVSNGDVLIALAIADTFDNARILGVATHDILAGQKGLITTFGEVNNIDTSAYTPGVPLYLSDTVAGTFTETPPDIVTRVGGVTLSSATTGQLFVYIINNKTIPNIFGGFKGLTVPSLSLTATPQDFVNYTAGNNVVVPIDQATGIITIPLEGGYRANFTSQISFASSTSTRSVTIEIYNVTTANVEFSYMKNIPRDATGDSFSFSWAITGLANDEYKARVYASTAMTVSFDAIEYYIDSINLR